MKSNVIIYRKRNNECLIDMIIVGMNKLRFPINNMKHNIYYYQASSALETNYKSPLFDIARAFDLNDLPEAAKYKIYMLHGTIHFKYIRQCQ
jgi:hypothetical protein